MTTDSMLFLSFVQDQTNETRKKKQTKKKPKNKISIIVYSLSGSD